MVCATVTKSDRAGKEIAHRVRILLKTIVTKLADYFTNGSRKADNE
jgi:hypothetical protein